MSEDVLQQIRKEFDATYESRAKQIKSEIDIILDKSIKRIRLIKRYKREMLSKYDIMKQNMVNIKDLLEDLKQKGNRVVGYGATAKFTNVMNMCGLDNTHIDYVLDTTPLKNNKWIPNTNVQIKAYSPQNIKDINYFYLGAWNYKKEILEKESDYLSDGGKFITHIPKVKILK